MSEAADKIVLEMQRNRAPAHGWDMPGLRRLTGLSVGAFAAAVAQLRREGRMAVFELALVGDAAAEPVAPAKSLAETVAAEARAAVDNRAAARATGHSMTVEVSIGAQMQERALTDAPAHAAAILKDRWGPTWEKLCRHAQATNQRPIPAMIALLQRGLEQEARP